MKDADWEQLEKDFPEFKWDPSVVSVGDISDPDPAIAYWKTRTPQERLRALEFLRQMTYGKDACTQPMAHVVEIFSR